MKLTDEVTLYLRGCAEHGLPKPVAIRLSPFDYSIWKDQLRPIIRPIKDTTMPDNHHSFVDKPAPRS